MWTRSEKGIERENVKGRCEGLRDRERERDDKRKRGRDSVGDDAAAVDRSVSRV